MAEGSADPRKRQTVGDLVSFRYGRSLPKSKRAHGPFPVYGSSGIVDWHRESFARGPGIIVGRKGSIGTVHYEPRDFWPIDTVFYLEPKCDSMDLYFLAGVLDQLGLDRFNTDSAVPGLNRNVALAQTVSVPPLPTQRKITAILSAYDALIDNSLRRIEILEEMAWNLYREWFVRFRFPGHERARFVDSTLGRIPAGWSVRRLGDVLDFRYGRALKKTDRRPGTVPVYGSSGVVGRHRTALVEGPGVIVGREGNVGSVFWSSSDFHPIDTVYYVTLTDLPLRFLYFDLQAKNFINSDAAVPGLSRKAALATEMVVPPVGVAEEFTLRVECMHGQRDLLVERNAALREARALLLPKLISGDLDVSDLPVRPRPLYLGDPHRITGYRFFRDIAALPFVEKIALFGSRARADHEERSDIDLCVFCGDVGEDEWSEVLACLERDRVDTLLKVDCARFETSNAALRENVLTEGIVLFERRGEP